MKIDSTFKQKVKKYFKYGTQIGSDLAEIAIHAKGKPTILSAVAVSSRIFHSYNKLTSCNARKLFNGCIQNN